MTVAGHVARMAATRLGWLGMRSARRLHLAAGRYAPSQAPAGVRATRRAPDGRCDTATDMYLGCWRLAGHTVECEPDGPFAERAGPDPWDEALHGFAWLRDLAAGGGELQRVHARGLIMDWIGRGCRKLPAASRPVVEAQRLTAWADHAPFLLHGAPETFESEFLAELGRAVRALALVGPAADSAAERLAAAAAVANASLVLRGYESLRGPAMAQLAHELERQTLPDGGHVSRSPQRLVECLTAVIPVLQTADDLRVAMPPALGSCVMRMSTALRFLVHRDGGLAVFNGVSRTSVREVGVLLLALPASSALPHRLPQSGYVRLSHGGTVIVADAGLAPAPGANAFAVPAPGAFEMSDGPNRIVVNCGAPQSGDRDWVVAARATAACSTAVIGEASAGRLFRSSLVTRIVGAPVLAGLERCEAEVDESQQGSLLKLVHDGYLARFGCWHERRLFLAAEGHDLRGEDSFHFDAPANLPPDFAIRFHLHPAVAVEAGETIRMTTPDGRVWTFQARGGTVAIEASVHLPDHPSPVASRQIVVRGATGPSRRVTWSFKRAAGLPR